MVRGLSTTMTQTLPDRRVVGILPPHLRTSTLPPCDLSAKSASEVHDELVTLLSLIGMGLATNGILLSLQCGRSKLSTASFVYIRIITLLQFVFFLLPLPLRFLTENLQRGSSWTSANFLPVLFGVWHFSVSSLVMCFAIRLQLLVNFVRRCRRWTCSGWIAWRKLFCILPLATITNVSLCFEYELRYDFCSHGNTRMMVGHPRPNKVDRMQQIALDAIRLAPTFIYWLTVLISMSFIISGYFVLPKLSSPFASRHTSLISNLRPILIGLVVSQSVVHLPSTYALLLSRNLDEHTKLSLYTVSYILPCPVLLLLSHRLRSHLWLILTRLVQSRKEAVVRKVTTGDGQFQSGAQASQQLGYSKLEMENSEIDERSLSNHTVRALLREDAVYRVRFAMRSTVPTVVEEDEEEESSVIHREHFSGDDEAPWEHASFVRVSDMDRLTDAVDV